MTSTCMTLPQGFCCASAATGLKPDGALDMALLYSQRPCAAAGVYTRNQIVAAPLQLTRQHLAAGECRAVLINSGNANACTGKAGMALARRSNEAVAAALKLPAAQVAVASTGVIGQQLPWSPFAAGIPRLVQDLKPQGLEEVAAAIGTTDQTLKLSQAVGDGYHVTGVAKGAGMIHPNMATMLAFVLTDAALPPEQLQCCLQQAVARSFNRISVDGDTSTNDMVLLLANGASDTQIASAQQLKAFQKRLDAVTQDLALAIVGDGEGATKVAHIHVQGAVDTHQAQQAAASIATSTLVKTAFFGADANWGRIIAALGTAPVELEPHKVAIWFDDVQVVANGVALDPELTDEPAGRVLQLPRFEVTVDLGLGPAAGHYYTSDLTYDYVRINADYRT